MLRKYRFILMVLLMGLVPLFAAKNQLGNPVQNVEKKIKNHQFGIVVVEPDEETLNKAGIEGGAEIVEVFDNSPAAEAGLKAHDIIIKFDGEPIEGPEDLAHYFSSLFNEKDVDIVVVRNGKELIFTGHIVPQELDSAILQLKLNAEKLRQQADSIKKRLKIDISKTPFYSLKGGYLGIEAETLTKQLADFFEVEYGVLVKEVYEDSPAAKAGIKAGDVIFKINDKEIKDWFDLIRTLNYYDPGDSITVFLKRKGQTLKVTAVLAKRNRALHHFENFRWPFPFYKHFEHENEDSEEKEYEF